MDELRWGKIKELFHQAVNLPDEQLASFLITEPDAEIRNEVKRLIAAQGKVEDFIDQPFLIENGITAPDPLIGKSIENYRILEKIGTGGMGVVYLAERIGSDFKHKVALKIIKHGMDSEAILKRFANERRILSTLRHPNIAQMLDGGIASGGAPFFVMEYVDGKPLNQYCLEKKISLFEKLELFQTVCAAVEHAHKNLVIHRDLKPSNILVTGDGIPKLLDFGIAKLLSEEQEETTVSENFGRVLTPEYASPEQISGKTVTTATDIYSLGVILYELLSGSRPFQTKGRSFDEIVKSVCETEPPRPSSVVSRPLLPGINRTAENKEQRTNDEGRLTNPKSQIPNPKSLRGDLDNIILKALRKEPADRYGSVQHFSEDIRRFLGGLPILARPQTLPYRFGKYVKRHKLGVLAAASVIISLIAGTSAATWQAFEAKRERDKANGRFEKLRDVAKLLMTETHDSLLKVPGNLKTQKNLVEKSVEVLNSIYDETGTDVQFLGELADSYDRLCRTQFFFNRDFQKAESICRKAVEIRRRVAGLAAENPQRQMELTGSILNSVELYQNAGDPNREIALRKEIERINRNSAEKNPDEQNLSALGLFLISFSQRLNSLEMRSEAAIYQKEGAEILQKLIDSKAGMVLSPQEKTDLAWKIMWLATTREEAGEIDAARKEFDKAARMAIEAYRADPAQEFAFNHASRSHRKLGEIYEKLGNYQKALEMYRFSLDWLKTRENSASMNKSNLIFGKFFYTNRCALMFYKLGRQKEAEEIIKTPLADYTAFLDIEENAASLSYAREPFLDLTEYFVATGQIKRAVQIWEKQILRLQNFLDKNPDDYYFLKYQIEALTKIGEIYSAFDKVSDSFKTTDRERLHKSKIYFQKAAQLLRQTQMIYQPTEAEKEELKAIEEMIEKQELTANLHLQVGNRK